MRFFLFAPIVLGCSVLNLGPPGSPTGGEFCLVKAGEPDACYPTRAEQLAAQRSEIAVEEQKREVELQAAHKRFGEEQRKQQAEEEAQRVADAKAREDAYAERRRKEQEAADAKAARAAELKRLAADPGVGGQAISAIICSIEAELVGLRAEIEKEKRTSAVSGAVDLRARHDLAAEIVSDTDEIKGWDAALRRLGAKRLPCKDVAPLVACRNRVESCDPAHRDAVEVWDKEQATLWGSDAERPHR